MEEVKLPDFFIAGATRSGTRSLYYYLKQHPQIFMPRLKELFFFSFMDTSPSFLTATGEVNKWLKDNIVSQLDDYINHFEDAKDNQIIGEVSPTYLYTYRDTICNIKNVYKEKAKDLKIIIILRHPAERAWSHFMLHRRHGNEPIADFREAIKPELIRWRLNSNMDISYDYTDFGMYYEQVKAFMEEFSMVKIFLYDELNKDGLGVIKEIYNFLGVDEDFKPDVQTRYNSSGEPNGSLLNWFIFRQYPLKSVLKCIIPKEIRKKVKTKFERNLLRRELPEDIKAELIMYYRDDILRLQGLIKKDLSSWLTVAGRSR